MSSEGGEHVVVVDGCDRDGREQRNERVGVEDGGEARAKDHGQEPSAHSKEGEGRLMTSRVAARETDAVRIPLLLQVTKRGIATKMCLEWRAPRSSESHV
jgi:hypothetical protein